MRYRNNNIKQPVVSTNITNSNSMFSRSFYSTKAERTLFSSQQANVEDLRGVVSTQQRPRVPVNLSRNRKGSEEGTGRKSSQQKLDDEGQQNHMLTCK